MNIYIMRHGTTYWNEKGITQGRSNNKLSHFGIELTEKVALNNKDNVFDVIFTSPLARTMQTAKIMNQYHNVKIIKDNRLTEIDQGIFTGRHKNSLSKQEQKLKRERSAKCGMENYEEVYQRAKSFFDDLLIKGYNNILIITHNCVATILANIITKKQKSDVAKNNYRDFDNAEIKKFTVEQ